MSVGECTTLIVNELARERATRFFRAPKIGHQRIRNRLVQKCGVCNISLVNVPKQRRRYCRDIFTTVIEMKWRWSLLCFALSFVISWTFFYTIYYLIAMAHGDFEHANDAEWIPCVTNGIRAGDMFLFSFTTQTTIGYGHRFPTSECPLLVMTMCAQFMFGVMCQTLMAGVIFAKLARPIKRAATILFSKNAVICMRDGKLCLLFRVGDMRKSSLAEAHVRLQMIKKCLTYEGELLPFHQFDMDVGYNEGLDRVFVMWPITVCHEIDENSPLYEINKKTLPTAKFEIIAILEGVVESVGSTTQARTSYLPGEILWGKRFEKLVTYQRENGEYHIDFGKFHNVYDVDTPTCSAKELDEMRAIGLKPEHGYQFVPIPNTDEDATTSVQVRRDQHTQRLAVLSDDPNNSNIQKCVTIESDDEDEGQNTITVDVGLKHRKSLVHSPSEFIGRRVSMRREPDLF
uniref:Inward rectifier potassium channel irk-1 n=1 Tax=Syphacia muris TaxID=451379 RepID=A0A0N5AYF8_9BILA